MRRSPKSSLGPSPLPSKPLPPNRLTANRQLPTANCRLREYYAEQRRLQAGAVLEPPHKASFLEAYQPYLTQVTSRLPCTWA